jgi:hypothetical protein
MIVDFQRNHAVDEVSTKIGESAREGRGEYEGYEASVRSPGRYPLQG